MSLAGPFESAFAWPVALPCPVMASDHRRTIVPRSSDQARPVQVGAERVHDQAAEPNIGLAFPREASRNRSKTHLAFVRPQPCLVCKQTPCDPTISNSRNRELSAVRSVSRAQRPSNESLPSARATLTSKERSDYIAR